MGKELILPKNIRQIGDIQGKEKIFLEDYVMTYIKKKEKQEQYLGIFLGERQEQEDMAYVFVRGILEVPEGIAELGQNDRDETARKEKGSEGSSEKSRKESEHTEENWMEKMEKDYQEFFPDWTVQGCCVIGQYPAERMRILSEALPEAGGLIYHLQDQEETVYRVENGRYRQIKGYFVFYEQNRQMQEYMSSVFSNDRVEKEGVSDHAIRNFRKKVKEKGVEKNTGFLKLASSFFVVTVLVIGAIMVNRIGELREMRTVVDTGGLTAENEIVYVDDTIEEMRDDSDLMQSIPVAENEILYSADSTEPVSDESAGNDSAETGTVSEGIPGSDSIETGTVSEGIPGSDSIETGTVSDGLTGSDSAETGTVSEELPGSDSTETGAAAGEPSDTEESIAEEASLQELEGPDSFWEESAQEAAAIRLSQAAYVIREGDTLADICNRYYGSLNRLAEICEINEIADADRIMPGQKILLP